MKDTSVFLCDTCQKERLFTKAGHAVGEKYFWTCAVCGESVAMTDTNARRLHAVRSARQNK